MGSISKAYAENRIALVVGNGNYSNAPLKATVLDARRMVTKLEALGFRVISLYDAGYAEFTQGLERFYLSLSPDAVAFFYFAGHGARFSKLHLLPIDAPFEPLDQLQAGSPALEDIQERLRLYHIKIAIMMIDACRSHALYRPDLTVYENNGSQIGKIPSGRSISQYSDIESSYDAPDIFIGYAGAEGEIAGENASGGYFTSALLMHIAVPGLTLFEMFSRVIREVEAQHPQHPWQNASMRNTSFVLMQDPAEVPSIRMTPGGYSHQPADSDEFLHSYYKALKNKIKAQAQ